MSDLEAMSLEELKKLQKDVALAIGNFEARRLAHARRELEAKAAELGVSLSDILGNKPAKGTKAVVAPKYRNPKNPAETWSGRGRKPRWLTVALTSVGAKLEDFLID